MKQLEDIETLHQQDLIGPVCGDPTLIHIASMIESRMKSADLYCPDCMLCFIQNGKVQSSFVQSKKFQTPCNSTFQICKAVDRYLRVQFLRGDLSSMPSIVQSLTS